MTISTAIQRPKVIIRHCESYDPEVIRGIIRESMEELDLRPSGRTLVKPNVVIADKLFPHAYTRSEFADGVLAALRDRDDGQMTELAVGERCGITMPTRFAFKNAGYPALFRKHNTAHYHFDEVSQVEVPLTHPGRLRDYVYTPEPVARADFFVNLPKFKAHPWTTVTFSLKNYIGIQDDRHRLIDHDHRLNDKIGDLQEILQPQLIAIDAIVAGQDRMLTPIPFDMKLIIIGNNQVAFDATCSRMIGLDPRQIDHIRICGERGYGPLDFEDVDVTGDVTFDEAKARAQGFRTGLIRVEKYFEGTKIQAYAGPPPEEEYTDYCWGGCPGAIEEAIEIIRNIDDDTDERMEPMTVVFGAYDGPIETRTDKERVLFIGDCAKWRGDIQTPSGGHFVSMESLYKERVHLDPRRSAFSGIYKKMGKAYWNLFRRRKEKAMRLTGCPVSVAEQVLYIAEMGKTANPYFAPDMIIGFNISYVAWKVVIWFRRLFGRKYQIERFPESERGNALHGPKAYLARYRPPNTIETPDIEPRHLSAQGELS